MSGVLILPRVEIFWGDLNLSHYPPSANWTPEGVPQPIVYDCTARQSEEGEMPSGSCKWVMSGPAFDLYKKLIADEAQMWKQWKMRFFYANGRSVTFTFLWAGQRFVYGNQMELEVRLASENEGDFNTVTRNIIQSTTEEEPITADQSLSKGTKQFGLPGDSLLLSPIVKEDVGKFEVSSVTAEDTTYTSFVSNIMEQNGNLTMANAMGENPGTVVVMPPYSWDKEPVLEPNWGAGPGPDPTKRYGYFLGPSIYSAIERAYEWQPPQLSQGRQGNFQTKVTPKSGTVLASWYGTHEIGNKTASGKVFTGQEMTAAHKSLPFGTKVRITNPATGQSQIVTIDDRGPFIAGREIDLSKAAAAKVGILGAGVAPVHMEVLGAVPGKTAEKAQIPTTAPVGTSRAKANPGIRSVVNPDGPKKQELMKEERQAQLSMSTLMTPALVGVKPHDILFIPDFAGSFIEDWVVNSVEYSQQGGGGVQISVQASRIYASGNPVNPDLAEPWLAKAQSLGLSGSSVSIPNWEAYAWQMGTSEATPGFSVPAPELGGATNLGNLTKEAKKVIEGGITTEKGDIFDMAPGIA